MFYTYYKKRGNKILLRYVKDGKKYTVSMDDYKPSLFFPNQQVEGDCTRSIYGEPLKKKTFDSIKDAARFGKDYAEMGGSIIYGNRLFENQCIIEMFEGQTPDFKRNQIDIGIVDIETDYDSFPNPQECKYQIQQINIKNTREQIHYSFGLKDFNQSKYANITKKCTVVHVQCDTEEALVESFIRHVEEKKYDMTSGWNSEDFDMPYIIERSRKILGKPMANRLSPFGLIYERETVNQWKNTIIKYDIVGLPHLDYMLVYKKHTYTPRENYKLDTIALAEGVAGKTDFSEVAGSLKELWQVDPDLYIAYNIQDCEIIDDLDKKLGLFDLVFTLAYLTLSNYEDSMGTTRIWEQFIAKHLYNQNVAPLFNQVDTPVREFEGAFVHPTQSGKHKWVASFDLKSLYPHIIQQVNIGPETIVPYHTLPDEVKGIVHPTNNVEKLLNRKIDTSILKKYNLSMAANGVFYTKEKQSFLSELMESLYSDRVVYQGKKKEAKEKLNAIKKEIDNRHL
jgi:DNA polymerase elongation subunit (family B)